MDLAQGIPHPRGPFLHGGIIRGAPRTAKSNKVNGLFRPGWHPSRAELGVAQQGGIQSAPASNALRRVPISVSQQTAPITFRKATSMPIGRDRLLNLIEISLDPLVLVVSLWAVAWVVGGHL